MPTSSSPADDYTLDRLTIPGTIVVRIPGRPDHFAETMHSAELFAQRLSGTAPIALPVETETSRAARVDTLVSRVLQRIEAERRIARLP
jgi:hypothetical protein